MQPKTFATGALAALVLAGCVPKDPDPEQTAACDIAARQDWIGQDIADVAVPTDMTVRILHPNDAATTDYLPTRLNILVDSNDKVIRVSCG